MHNRLLTTAERKQRHLVDHDVYQRCSNGVETVLHALRDCDFSMSIWCSLVHPSNWSVFFTLPLDTWLVLNLINSLIINTSVDWPVLFGGMATYFTVLSATLIILFLQLLLKRRVFWRWIFVCMQTGAQLVHMVKA